MEVAAGRLTAGRAGPDPVRGPRRRPARRARRRAAVGLRRRIDPGARPRCRARPRRPRWRGASPVSVLAPAPDFDAEDGFLHALLGLVAADAAVRELAPSTSPPPGPCAAGHDAGDPVLDAILGLIRLTSLASQVASSWATAPRDVALAPELASTSAPIEGLLR